MEDRYEEKTSDIAHNENGRVTKTVELSCEGMISRDFWKMKNFLIKRFNWQCIKSDQRKYQAKEIHHLNWEIKRDKKHMEYNPQTRNTLQQRTKQPFQEIVHKEQKYRCICQKLDPILDLLRRWYQSSCLFSGQLLG